MKKRRFKMQSVLSIAASLLLGLAVVVNGTPNEEAAPPESASESAPESAAEVPSEAVESSAEASTASEPATESEAGEVQERAVIRDHRGQPGQVLPPKASGGPAPKVLVPGITGPTTGTLALPDRYTAPTDNLTRLANALRFRHKSLSMLVSAPPGLQLTNPINIRVTYNSASSGSRWRQGQYNPTTGYRDFQNDPVGNRYPRRVTIDLLLTEFPPGNQPITFPIKWDVNLDPLFDVTISPMRFKLNSDCDRIGKSEIRFSWTAPDKKLHKKGFSMSKGQTVTINEFAWSRQEVSSSADLYWMQWGFREDDPVGPFGAWLEGFGPQTIKLLPESTTGYVGRTIKESRGQKCSADIAFDMAVSVRQYLNL